MLDGLKNNLRDAIKKIVKSSGIDEELIKQLSKDVQRALLQSDVNVRLVLEITKQLETRSLNETPPPGLSRKDHIVKILYEELAKLLGKETDFDFKPGKQNKIIMLGILAEDYVRTAGAKGLSPAAVLRRHALRNAALPVVTLCGWELIRAVAGYSVVVETVFAWPGLGLTAIQAIERDDLILLQAIVFAVAILVVLINILMDVAYKAIDPRLKLT